ncbi:type II toxin-antitoxin system VapC family toxin [Pseudonocardia kunmingensis]|uniref:type II toxin-antitoxin system VapC family toxin n=1 Tax=Pseudonocardia kunmingensis TaxID=630975 RepID=UPI0011539375|nr:type II toxin-antitoxin system VapC family toxin [Pseudonocardia kunmingensis]
MRQATRFRVARPPPRRNGIEPTVGDQLRRRRVRDPRAITAYDAAYVALAEAFDLAF